MKSIYVGNLPFSASETEVNGLFAQYGAVTSVKLVIDRETGRARGFGFVQMSDDNAALAAIDALNGKDFGGRALKINEAKERTERRPSGGGFRGGDRRGNE